MFKILKHFPIDRYSVLMCLLLSSLQQSEVVAGIYTGVEADKENSGIAFIGGQTGGPLFLHFFLGQLQYEYTDADQLVETKTDILDAAIGYRMGAHKNYAIIAGPSHNEKRQTRSGTETTENTTGGFIQFAATAYRPKYSTELLLSYSSIDRFLWSRARYKHKINSWFFPGLEVFAMGNDDADSYGTGLLFDMNTKNVNTGFKLGYKKTTNNKERAYAGLEFYVPF